MLSGAKGETACRMGIDRAFPLSRHPHFYGAIQRKGSDTVGGLPTGPLASEARAQGRAARPANQEPPREGASVSPGSRGRGVMSDLGGVTAPMAFSETYFAASVLNNIVKLRIDCYS